MRPALKVLSEEVSRPTRTPCILLAGQPNAGKTSLFNHLTGLRAHTANFPGTTVEVRKGQFRLGSQQAWLVDLPGLYGLEGKSLEQTAAQRAIRGEIPNLPKADLLVVVLDATRLPHHLPLAAELRDQDIPVLIALNMIDQAKKKGIKINIEELSKELGAPVIQISARKKIGITNLVSEIDTIVSNKLMLIRPPEALSACRTCGTCPITARCSWADDISKRVTEKDSSVTSSKFFRKLDEFLTNPLFGLPFFALTMFVLFSAVFSLATVPMDLIDSSFSYISSLISNFVPWSLLSSFLADGVVSGVGGVVIFVPQIFILFFGISILEDSGYLSRAVVAVDRIMRKFGLPGQAFIPMLSAHACAVPAIMSTRVIENRLDRLRAILVIPLLTCSARLPVYLMIAVLLFGNNSLAGSLLFFAGYFIGALAAILVSIILQRTIVKGSASRLAIELPPYRFPSLRVAFAISLQKSWTFLKQAGTVILFISLILWGASTFPNLEQSDLLSRASLSDKTKIVEIEKSILSETGELRKEELRAEYDGLYAKYALEYSLAGRVGKIIEPVFEPLGFDWRISVGVLSSFAAREVIVSSLAVMAGVGSDASESDEGLIGALRNMKRSDGSLLFNVPTALSLFVFFVLAMQCLPTQAITLKETGSWKWPVFQLAYMSALAYGAAFLTYHLAILICGV